MTSILNNVNKTKWDRTVELRMSGLRGNEGILRTGADEIGEETHNTTYVS